MAVAPQIEQLSQDESVRLSEREGAFVILTGEKKPEKPPVTEAPHGLTHDSNRVRSSRIRDVMYFEQVRFDDDSGTGE